MTERQRLEARLTRLLDEIAVLADQDEFDEEDPWRFVRDAAAMWERVLKRCTLTNPPKDPTLNNLINATQGDGLPLSTRDALHRLRNEANKAKHDPSRLISTAEAHRLIEESIPAGAQLDSAGVPELGAPAKFGQRRRYLVGVYDHLTGGETEYSIWLAGHAPRSSAGLTSPTAVEIFGVKHSAEKEIKARLDALGDAQFVDAVDDDTLVALRSDEFAEAWLWEGSHRDLVSAFALSQWHFDVIPGLSRADHAPSVMSAAALALVDVARPASWEDLLWKMSTDYGIWRRGKVVQEIAHGAADLVGGTVEHALYGPRWIAGEKAEALLEGRPYIRHAGCVFGVTEECVVIVGIDVHPQGIAIRVMTDRDLERPPDPFTGSE